MKFKKIKNILPFWICFLILAAYTVYFILSENYEFITYTISISVAILFLYKTDEKFKYSYLAKWGFTLVILLHLMGGSVRINGIRLYDFILIPILGEPFNILRYDQFLHFICYSVIALLMYPIVYSMDHERKKNRLEIAVVTLLAAVGIGAIAEIIEFAAVVFFDAGRAVGDYYNNSLDLVFNFIGAIAAVLFLSFKKIR